MNIVAFDHVAIPTAQPEAMLVFYRAIGFSAPTPEAWRASQAKHFAVQFGENKINMHAPALWQDDAFTLRGVSARPGCGDFCFVWAGSLADIQARLQALGAPIELGPVQRVGGRDGGRAKGTSVYTRDPDQNLLEFIVY
jgi:catechol 2,3-dioxygenase-like lactoylglutathione lyase family enzyme